jgi:hypothetical protein
MLPLPLFLQQVADTVPAHPDWSHFAQSASLHRRQIFEPQQMPSPCGGGLSGQAQSGGGGGGVPLEPPLDVDPPSAKWMSGTFEHPVHIESASASAKSRGNTREEYLRTYR